ncbi:CHAD domain-containing protein [Bradyrhizobium sp.]|uniref:CYTH and CHAD domain-containing protein n=1 Tax=Bradyrhizobium sp. TaxID=376 RepID=UPI0039C85C62
MSETAALRRSSETARTAAGLKGKTNPSADRKATEQCLDSAFAHEASERRLHDTGSAETEASQATPSAGAEGAAPQRGAQQGSELELKLLVDPELLADFNNAPVIATNARNKGSRKHLKATYYDTPERTLWRNRLSFRVRQTGSRFTQTVKAETGDDPLRRGEWEASVPSMAPDLALAMPIIPAKLRSDLETQKLEPVFVTDIRRHQRVIDLPSGTVDVALDRGTLKAGDRSAPVNEIELELKSGSASAIWELALQLAEHGSVKPSIRSKSARGFDLAADLPPAARKPRKLHLEPSIALDDAFATILRCCFQHLLESMPAAEDGRDSEGVHQLRVSLRRLRSAFDLMKSAGTWSKLEALRSEARWFTQNLSAARDWDIFRSSTLPTIAKACPSIAGFDALAQLAEGRRSAAYDTVRQVLADPRCARFVIELGGWIEARGWRSDVPPENLTQLAEPAIKFAGRLLTERHMKALKRGRHFKSLGTEERHRLRLAIKKLRYAVDFLLPMYGHRKPIRRFFARLADLQEELGSYNDMATTSALLAGLNADASDGGTAAAAIAGWQAHAMVGAERRLREAWSDFTKVKAPWPDEAAG